MIDSEKDNASLIALLMSYQTFDPTIVVPHNARLADMLVFTVSELSCFLFYIVQHASLESITCCKRKSDSIEITLET